MITLPFFFPSRRVLPTIVATLLGLAVSTAAPAATITVNSTSDLSNPGGGACSLRGAVDAVNNGADGNGCAAVGTYGTSDTIVFDTSLASQSIIFGSQITLISKDLVINGIDAPGLTLDGNNATRLLYNAGGTGSMALTVANLTFQNGRAPSNGGAIHFFAADKALKVLNCTFSNNQAPNGGWGGAIYASQWTLLEVENSVFTSNTATGQGGAISSFKETPPAKIINSTFTRNTALSGGALSPSAADIRGSTFIGNSSTASGGAIQSGFVTIDASTFIDNSAASSGGAIQMQTGSSSLNGLTLVNNISMGGGGFTEGSAVYLTNSATATMVNSLIVGDASVALPLCGKASAVSLSGSANLEWRNGSNENSCNTTAPVTVPATITALTAIVADALANNGGPTQTLALPSGSPALGKANATTAAIAPSTPADQRGVIRDAAPDLGAYESLLIDGLPDGTNGQAYSGSVAAGSGTAPIAYTLDSGSLPSGLTLNSATGAVTGTPDATGTYTFTITATETASNNFTRWNFSVTILANPPPGAAAIPALGPWALLALVGLLGGAGVMRRRG